jgi:hypothetical protein
MISRVGRTKGASTPEANVSLPVRSNVQCSLAQPCNKQLSLNSGILLLSTLSLSGPHPNPAPPLTARDFTTVRKADDEYRGVTYLSVSERRSFADADAACTSLGGRLATIWTADQVGAALYCTALYCAVLYSCRSFIHVGLQLATVPFIGPHSKCGHSEQDVIAVSMFWSELWVPLCLVHFDALQAGALNSNWQSYYAQQISQVSLPV